MSDFTPAEEEEFAFRHRYEQEQAAKQGTSPPDRNTTFIDQLKHQLGRTARMGAEIAGGTVGAAGDFMNAGINMATGSNLQMPSQMLAQGLDKMGLPRPQGTMENIVDFAGKALGGPLDPAQAGISRAVGGMVPQGFQATQPSANQQTIRELHDAGYSLSPAQLGAGPVARFAEGVTGGSSAYNAANRAANQPVTQGIAAREAGAGIQPGNITRDALDAAIRGEAQQGYAPVRNLGTLNLYGNSPVSNFGSDLARIRNQFSSVEEAPQLRARINQLSERRMDANDLLEYIRQIRSDSNDAFKAANPSRTYGEALHELANSAERQIERNLPPGSPLMEGFRSARTQIAKDNALKEMLSDADTGMISTTKAQRLLDNGMPLSEGLRTIAKAGAKQFVGATDTPVQGVSGGVPWNNIFRGGLGGALGYSVYGFPGALAGAAAAPLGKKVMLSDTMQNMMVDGMPSLFGGNGAAVGAGMFNPNMPFFSQGGQ